MHAAVHDRDTADERAAYYERIRPLNLAPLWESLHTLVRAAGLFCRLAGFMRCLLRTRTHCSPTPLFPQDASGNRANLVFG